MSESDAADPGGIDLEACAREPIHIPGAIQPHGCLVAFDPASRVVRQVSANVDAFLGLEPRELLGQPIATALPPEALARLQDALAPGPSHAGPATLPLQTAGRRLEGALHRHAAMAILEIETAGEAAPAGAPSLLDRGLRRLAHLEDLPSLMAATVEVVRDLTGFERVLAYRFDDDDHGEVIAEARTPEVEPYLGLHFPESDIPRQARELYRRNWIRAIPDARYQPVPLVPPMRPDNGEPLDLTHALLRSVSAVHLEYLANMGLQASMSVSLIVDGRLWGLVSCGHRTPRAMPSALRGACETIGRFVSMQIGALLALDLDRRKAARSGGMRALIGALGRSEAHAFAGLPGQDAALLEVSEAAGAVPTVTTDSPVTIAAPEQATALAIAKWVGERTGASGVYATRQLSIDEPRWRGCAAQASGVLAIVLPTPLDSCVLWFRPELVQTVRWGGDPEKPVAPAGAQAAPRDGARLHPRRSFDSWKQEVRGRSLPWGRAELDAAAELRRTAIEIDLTRQVQRAQAAVQARDEMVAVVAHDLRTPMSVVVMQSAIIQRLLLAMESTADTTQRLRASAQIVQRAGERMASLLNDLLDLARIEAGRFNVAPGPVSVETALGDAYELLHPVCEARRQRLLIHQEPDLVIQADVERLFQVLSNLIGNAAKFSPEGSSIDVRAARTGDGFCELSVTDRGVGIPPDTLPRIFDRYWKERTGHAGAGLGLYIARGIVEAHGGAISAESGVGEGTTVRFTIPLAGASGRPDAAPLTRGTAPGPPSPG